MTSHDEGEKTRTYRGRLQSAASAAMFAGAFAVGAAASVQEGVAAKREYGTLSAAVAQAYDAAYGAIRSPERLDAFATSLGAVEERLPRYVPMGSLEETAQRLHASARTYLPLNGRERQAVQPQVEDALRALQKAQGHAALYAVATDLAAKGTAVLLLGAIAYAFARKRA